MNIQIDPNSLFFMLLFSVIGIGYFNYGRKNNIYFMVSGILLMVYTYFVNNLVILIAIGTLLVIIPFVLNKISPLP